MSEHFVLPKDEYTQCWTNIQAMYNGLEVWQREEVYCQARKRGLDKDAAWLEMVNMPVVDLPKVVFVWDGIKHDVPELEDAKDD